VFDTNLNGHATSKSGRAKPPAIAFFEANIDVILAAPID
jgi:hypothetical protein